MVAVRAVHAVCRLLAVDAASVKVIDVRFSAPAVIVVEAGIVTGIVPPLIVIALFPGRRRIRLLIIVVRVSGSVAVIIISPVGLIIVASVARVILSIVVSCVIIVLGVICIIFRIGTLVCSVVIFRVSIALPG